VSSFIRELKIGGINWLTPAYTVDTNRFTVREGYTWSISEMYGSIGLKVKKMATTFVIFMNGAAMIELRY